MFKQKLETFVDFPINGLDMTDYLINTKTPSEYENETEDDNGEQKKNKILYDLYAISNHFGGLGGGHYTAFAKNKVIIYYHYSIQENGIILMILMQVK